VALFIGTIAGSANNISGPSSSATPYIVRSVPGVVTKSILTVGDSVNLKPDGITPYRLVGIPDGLGAFDNGDGTFTVLMNHELGATAGIVREHGAPGAFVSKWIIRKGSLEVLHGEDLIHNIATWNVGLNSYNPPAAGIALGRLCSADLAAQSAFFNEATGLGFDGRLFLSGEEVGNEGREFGHTLSGTSYELPRLGKFSWENSVANPATGNKTVVVGMDDSTPGQVYVYIGDKTDTGNPVQKAGLSNGNLYGVKVNGIPTESRDTGISSGTQFTLHNLGNVQNKTGTTLQADSTAAAITEFLRPEDGAWDPSNPRDFYFVTTDRFDQVKANTGTQVGRSRLYRLHFNSLNDLTAGGHIDMLLDGTEPQQMMDNITITRRGQVVIQEDPGNQSHIARIWRYSIENDTLNEVAQHDENRFFLGGLDFLTQDEESSGIIDVSHILGEGWFLLDVQAHYSLAGELVEGGQLLALHYPPGKK
jgi:hypothetical protein